MNNPPLTYVGDRTKSAYKWDKPLSTADWVEKNVRLNSDTSPLVGNMNLKYTPHLKEMFDDYDKTHVWKQIGEFSTQTAKTTFMFCCMTADLDRKPTKVQFAIPNESGVTEYIEDKVDPFVRGIKSLNTKVEDYKQKEKLRTKRTRIKVAGGDIVFTGTSASSKRSKTVKRVFMDEADLFDDGSIVEIEGRTKSFEKYGRKVVAVSSQSKKNGEISKAFASCETHKEWHTTCNKCLHHWLAGSNHLKWLSVTDYMKLNDIHEDKFMQLQYKLDALKDVYVECPECSHHLSTQEKDKNILNGVYMFHITQGAVDGKTIGYRGNALAMFFTSFETIASLIIDAESTGTFDDMRQIYLDYFNEIYEPELEESTSKNDILLLSNGLPEFIIPKDTVKLYLLVDTQKVGFWGTVVAVGYGFNLHVVLARKLNNFKDIEALLGRVYKDDLGNSYGIDKFLIDRLGIKERTIEVDQFIEYLVVKLGLNGVAYPTMGQQTDSAGRLWYETTVTKELSTGERRKTSIKAIKVNNTLVKIELNNLIQRSIKQAKCEEGYEDIEDRLFSINQTIVDDEENAERSLSTHFSRQMTSEDYVYKVDKKTGKIATTKTWEKRHNTIDNHYFDNLVLAVVAALMDNVNLMQKPLLAENEDFDELIDTLFD